MAGRVREEDLGALPPGFAARVREMLDRSVDAAVTRPRDAATVVLVRDGPDGPEVLLQRRHGGMAFAGGMTVFPGGALDPADPDVVADGLVGALPPGLASGLHAPRDLAAALLVAAAREVFEEVGVLLAVPAPAAAAAAAAAPDVPFGELLRGAGLVVDPALLCPWSVWVTPEIEPRRYDTRFLLAAMPEGQVPALHDGSGGAVGEADRVWWCRPADALAQASAGELRMMPPTVATLTDVAGRRTVADLLAAGAGREVLRRTPRFVVDNGAAGGVRGLLLVEGPDPTLG